MNIKAKIPAFKQGSRHNCMMHIVEVKFIYSKKAKKFCEIFTLLLSYAVPVKSKVRIVQNFVAISEYMNFKSVDLLIFDPLPNLF